MHGAGNALILMDIRSETDSDSRDLQRGAARVNSDDAKHVIEVGCSSGALAQEYLKSNSERHHIGIETDPEYAEIARKNWSRVIACNFEQHLRFRVENLLPADCWICGDVLEST